MEKDIIVQASHISKAYRMYASNGDRLKEALDLTHKKRHQLHYALNDVTFDVHKGETVGIIGVNGSGKSTLLKILTGVVTPTTGAVTVNGKISALLELGAGFNPDYTGIQNIYLNGTIMGYTHDEMEQKIASIIEFADIGEFVNQPVKTYSSGMFARLAFAVAINVDPDLLIVDEALSVGDVFFQNKCFHKFEELQQLGTTILFVSHDLASVAKYCSRIILLDKGSLIMDDVPKPVVDSYKRLMVNLLTPNADIEGNQLTSEDGERWSDSFPINPDLLEYGNHKADIVDFAILDNKGRLTSNLIKGEKFSVRLKVRFNEALQSPIMAFTIKNRHGTELCGTNTMYEKVTFKDPKAGDVKTAVFTQSMDLQGGNYLLSLGTSGYIDGEYTVYHRKYDVCTITVISDKDTVGFYDMNSDVSVYDV
ncbi:MAG: ABC transporter ATP-binding protein [Ruthenibacterium sp.]